MVSRQSCEESVKKAEEAMKYERFPISGTLDVDNYLGYQAVNLICCNLFPDT